MGTTVTEADKFAALMNVVPRKRRDKLVFDDITTYAGVRKYMKAKEKSSSYSASFAMGSEEDGSDQSGDSRA